MITRDKITEIFCIADDFCKEFDVETGKMGLAGPAGGKRHKRKWQMSRAEIMTILICFHFNDFRNFQHYSVLPLTSNTIGARKKFDSTWWMLQLILCQIFSPSICIWAFLVVSLHRQRKHTDVSFFCFRHYFQMAKGQNGLSIGAERACKLGQISFQVCPFDMLIRAPQHQKSRKFDFSGRTNNDTILLRKKIM